MKKEKKKVKVKIAAKVQQHKISLPKIDKLSQDASSQFNFSQIEKKWQSEWEKSKIFEAREGKGKKCYVLEMYPYPSASGLHMGHALNYTIGDIQSRMKRMQGFNVLYPMGFDSFGLPAENAAIQAKSHPKKFTEEAIKNYMRQMKELGLSYDWSRLIMSHSPDYYKWDQWLFLQMFKKGLAYRKTAAVNFCEKCNTVLANEQVHDGKCWRHKDTDVELKQLEQWFFKITEYADELYNSIDSLKEWPERIRAMQKNWIGKSHGTEIVFEIENSDRDIKNSEFVFLHAFQDNFKSAFWEELKQEIEKRKGKVVFAPDLPNTNNPNLKEQENYILKNYNFKENTVLVTHSLGAVLAMKILPKIKNKIKRLVMIAPPIRPQFKPEIKDKKIISILENYCDWNFDYEKIKSKVDEIVILSCINDHIVPFSHGKELAKNLNVRLIEAEGIKSHFNGKKEPEVEKIVFEINGERWPIFTTRPDTIYGVTFMVISAQHPKLMSLVTEKQKKEVQAFLKKIKSTSEKDKALNDELDKEGAFTGSYAINPITKEKIPIWVGNFVVADYGSGMVMAVPAHDQRDFEFAIKYGIPIKQVIKPPISKSIVLGGSVEQGFKEELKKNNIQFGVHLSSNNREHIGVILKNDQIDNYVGLVKKYLKKNFWVEIIGNRNLYVYNKQVIENFLEKDKENFEIFKKLEPLVRKYKSVWDMLNQNSFYNRFVCYTNEGILMNSKEFSGLNNIKAIEEITKYLEKHKLGKKVTQFKLRDWLISRQRFWGTPIPIIYCDKCGAVPVPEQDLPVILPEDIKFKSEKNPLVDDSKFINTRCPKCGGKATRETDTMDTFVNSSWYFLRYTDPKNSKEIFDKKKAAYWTPVDIYIGGAEHACMHLIYFRFYTKFLRDIGLLKIDEPAKLLFNQGMLHGEDGFVMSKSRGNVVLPEEVSKRYGIDTARLFLVSMASPDKDVSWSASGIEGSLRIINKIMNYFNTNKNRFSSKSSPKIESKMNKAIKEITEDISLFRYNLAVIKIRQLFEAIEQENEKDEKSISKQDAESFLKLLHPFCPHITEELWHALGNKTFISLESWPKANEGKINENIEKQEEQVEKTLEDIKNIIRIVKEKQNKEAKRLYLYVIPNELSTYKDSKNTIEKSINLSLEIFAVNDKNKIDPQNKAQKAKPGKPAIYLE